MPKPEADSTNSPTSARNQTYLVRCQPILDRFRPTSINFGLGSTNICAEHGIHISSESTNRGPNRLNLARTRPTWAQLDQNWPEFDKWGPTFANFDQHWHGIDQSLLEFGQLCRLSPPPPQSAGRGWMWIQSWCPYAGGRRRRRRRVVTLGVGVSALREHQGCRPPRRPHAFRHAPREQRAVHRLARRRSRWASPRSRWTTRSRP